MRRRDAQENRIIKIWIDKGIAANRKDIQAQIRNAT
jgi:hypothetical protein